MKRFWFPWQPWCSLTLKLSNMGRMCNGGGGSVCAGRGERSYAGDVRVCPIRGLRVGAYGGVRGGAYGEGAGSLRMWVCALFNRLHWMVTLLKGCTRITTQSTCLLSSHSPFVFLPDPTLSTTPIPPSSRHGLFPGARPCARPCAPSPGHQQGKQRVPLSQEAEDGASGM